jgi:hypothetical protein
MSVNINSLVNQAFATIEQVMPDAIVQGRLVKYDSVYDRDTAKYANTESDSQDVKCVFDESEEYFRISENSNTTTIKIHVFGLLDKTVDMFDELELTLKSGVKKYKTSELTSINVGTSAVLHTFIITN